MRYYIVQVSFNVNYSPKEIEYVITRTYGKKFFKKFDADPSDFTDSDAYPSLFMSEKALGRLVDMNSTLNKKGRDLVVRIHNYKQAPEPSKWHWSFDEEDVYVYAGRHYAPFKVCEVVPGGDNDFFNQNVIDYLDPRFKNHLEELDEGGYVYRQLISDLLDGSSEKEYGFLE